MAQGGVVNIRGLAGQKVVSPGTSAALPGGQIDVSCDAEMFIAQGANPTAVADVGYRLLPGATYRFSAEQGDVIDAVGAGNLWVHPVA